MATMRRDHAEDNRYFDRIAANRAKAADTTKLADMLVALAETQDGEKHIRIMTLAVQAQDAADKGRAVSTSEALMVVEMALRALGLVK